MSCDMFAGDSEDALRFLQQQSVQDSTLVSSVYLDDPDFQTYRSRYADRQYATIMSTMYSVPGTDVKLRAVEVSVAAERARSYPSVFGVA